MRDVQLSIVVPVFNGRKYLRTAVKSLLHEDIPALQIIVVDDGSTDGSAESVADLPGVERVRLSENKGVAAARNAGMDAVRGTHVTFLDSDDTLCPDGLHWRIQWLKENPEARALAGRPAGVIDEKGNIIPDCKHVLRPGYSVPAVLTWEFFQRGGTYPVALWNYVFETSLMRQVGRFNETLRIGEDCEYLFRVLKNVSIPLVFKPVVYRRIHKENISVQRDGATKRISLRPETVAACQDLYKRLGIPVTDWNPWELGYAS